MTTAEPGRPDRTLPPGAFAKADLAPDGRFYARPRFVTHIDGTAVAAVMELYRTCLPAGGRVLDLMSSWVSHLPEEVAYAEVVGLGMNAAELAANPRLTRAIVRDLNADPALPLDTGSLDAAAICVSVQYLQDPVAVLTEVARVLRPGAPLVLTVSNRCFPTKAVAIWLALDGPGRERLLALCLERAGFARLAVQRPIPEGGAGDPLTALVGWTG